MSKATYSEDHIQTLDSMKHIRHRPTMYIEELGSNGVMRLAYEIFQNVVDEYLNGNAHNMYVTVNEATSEVSVEDDGRGVPIGKIKDAFGKINTGGKYNNDAYKRSIGQNGVGAKAVTALSTEMCIIVCRDGVKVKTKFNKGDIVEDTHEIGKSTTTGTKVSFTPDKSIFGDITIKVKLFAEILKRIAYINPGLRVKFSGTSKDGKTHVHEFFSKNGLSDYLKEEISGNHNSILPEPITFNKANSEMEIMVSFTFCGDLRRELLYSFVNGFQTRDHGFHVTAFKKAISTVILEDMRANPAFKKEQCIESLAADDIYEGLAAVILAYHNKPTFDGQTKNKFSSLDYEAFAKDAVMDEFKNWISTNKTKYQNFIQKYVLLNCQARYAASKARNLVRQTQSANLYTGISNPTKFVNCSSKDPKERELFILEGESAAGNMKDGRNKETQAIYKLKGKPNNTYKMGSIDKLLDKDSRSSEIKDLIVVQGCGYGPTFDITKLNFDKIIIESDADDDGYHIRSLLLGFYYMYYRDLIVAGKIYVANPPLFMLKIKNKEVFIVNKQHYYTLLEKAVIDLFDLVSIVDKKEYLMSEEFFKCYLVRLRGYSEMVDGISDQIDVHPHIIEASIIHYNEVLKYKKCRLNGHDLDVEIIEGEYVLSGVYLGRFYRMVLDEFMMRNVFGPILKQLNLLKYYQLYLKYSKTDQYFGPSPYMIDKLINHLLQSNGSMKRFKGLGEMSVKQLQTTTLNPDSRVLTKITLENIDNYAKYDKVFDTLLGKDIDSRKEYYKELL